MIVVAALAVACGTSPQATSGTDGDRTTGATEAPGESTTTTSGSPGTDGTVPQPSTGGSTTTTAGTPLPPLDGPPAPDFSLQLSDGSTFLLSEESRPVYMVFWAEW